MTGSIVTDSSLCTFDVDSGLVGSQFRLIFTPDPASPGLFKSTASNPGQFYYNVFVTATGTVDLTLTLPYPFVTQGAVPIHAYDSATFVTVGGQTCILPGNEVYHSTTQVTLASYGNGANFGSTTTVHIVFAYTGFVYVNIHLDYGTKGSGGWQKQPNTQTGGNDAVNTNTTSPFYGQTIVDQTPYPFSFSMSGDGSDTQTVQSENVFKKDPGFAGQVVWIDGNGGTHGVQGVVVNVYGPNGALVGSGVTDADGFWMVAYKYTGKAATFQVCLPAYPGVPCQYVTMKSNSFVYVPPFVIPQPPGAQPEAGTGQGGAGPRAPTFPFHFLLRAAGRLEPCGGKALAGGSFSHSMARLEEIEERVRGLASHLGEPPEAAKGAVSLLFREGKAVEVLLIERAERAGDPWSGQLAFPGGGRHVTDRDLLETAVRETAEEVHVALEREARLVGRLPPRAPANRVEWLVVPYVFVGTRPVVPVPGEEAARAFWTPLDALPGRLYVATIELPGRTLEMPAFEVSGMPLWGFSFRVLCDLFDVVGWPAQAGRPSIANLK